MKTMERARSLAKMVIDAMSAPLRADAAHIVRLSPSLSAMNPLDSFAKNPDAGRIVAINPAVARLMPRNSTR